MLLRTYVLLHTSDSDVGQIRGPIHLLAQTIAVIIRLCSSNTLCHKALALVMANCAMQSSLLDDLDLIASQFRTANPPIDQPLVTHKTAILSTQSVDQTYTGANDISNSKA
jgi:hypothetical protein